MKDEMQRDAASKMRALAGWDVGEVPQTMFIAMRLHYLAHPRTSRSELAIGSIYAMTVDQVRELVRALQAAVEQHGKAVPGVGVREH